MCWHPVFGCNGKCEEARTIGFNGFLLLCLLVYACAVHYVYVCVFVCKRVCVLWLKPQWAAPLVFQLFKLFINLYLSENNAPFTVCTCLHKRIFFLAPQIYFCINYASLILVGLNHFLFCFWVKILSHVDF